MFRFSKKNQKILAIWAVDIAKRMLPYFEKKYPKDKRPKKAIEALKAWIRGEIRVGPVRKAALAAHTAARRAKNLQARFAARTIGQAASTPHVAAHALAASYYAVKVVGPKKMRKELSRQHKRLPKNLRKRVMQISKKLFKF